MIFIFKFILVMVSTIFADIAWTFYFIKVSDRKSITAGLWSSMIILFGAFTAINYVHDSRFIIAASIGAFIGTYITVEYEKRKNKNDDL